MGTNQLQRRSSVRLIPVRRNAETAFAQKLQGRFQIVREPAPKTIRLKLTLTGATTTPVIGTFTHLDMAGSVYNGVQAVRGRAGLNAGSASYAVEISDATTGKLLIAYVTRQFPGALNVMASFGTLQASKVGIEKGADRLLAQLQ